MNPIKWIYSHYSNQKIRIWHNKERGNTNRKIFDSIYKNREWGGNPQEFYSGDGSRDITLVEPYIQTIKNLIKEYEFPPIIVDLGCGDFFIGKHIYDGASKYYAVDVADNLISQNLLNYQDSKLTFQNIDAAHEELPNADIILIRQVLQHLNNESIAKIVKKLWKFENILITEHLPSELKFHPNIDINTGPGIRLTHNSGVVIHEAPFSFTGYSSKTLLDIPGYGGRIVTTHYKRNISHAK
jgi:Methyltransferase domain